MAISPISFAHHNSSTPERVDPGWYGLEDSPHNEQIDFALSQQQSGVSESGSQTRSSYMKSVQTSSQSGDITRSRVH
jgi:hypothetical protein